MRIQRIVVGTDFSEVSLRAVETALSLDIEEDGTLYLLHVIEGPPSALPVGGRGRPGVTKAHRAAMEALRELVPGNWQKSAVIETSVTTGSPAAEIARFAREKGADMIVVGTHGRTGLARVLVGSTAESLLSNAPCQVLVVK